jgi:pimeloyl-ACP methyl ester carboxylesterase
MPERVSFSTLDDVTIVGDWVTAPTMIGAVLLLHMMPATRQSWEPLQRALAAQGVASLAIDLRGHGESNRDNAGATLDYKRFTDPQHAASIHDVAAAVNWMWYASENPATPAIALLSPGEQYRGISALDAAPNILPHQRVWMAASSVDDEESVHAVDTIATLIDPEQVTREPVQNAGHGTAMLNAHPALMNGLVTWIKDCVIN